MTKNHYLLFCCILLLAVVLIAAQPALSYADGEQANAIVLGLFDRHFSDKQHPFKITTRFAFSLFSIKRDETKRLNQDIREWVTASDLYRLLSNGLGTATEIGQIDQLHTLLKFSTSFEFSRDNFFNPYMSSNLAKHDRESSISGDNEKPVISPGIYNYSHRNFISVSLPIALTECLTIAPIISYAFPLNISEPFDSGSKGILNIFDQSGSITYGGLYIKYTF